MYSSKARQYDTVYTLVRAIFDRFSLSTEEEIYNLIIESGDTFANVTESEHWYAMIADEVVGGIAEKLNTTVKPLLTPALDAFLRLPKSYDLSYRILEKINVSLLGYHMQDQAITATSTYSDLNSPIQQHLASVPSFLVGYSATSRDPLLSMQPYDEAVFDFYLYWLNEKAYRPSDRKVGELLALQVSLDKSIEMIDSLRGVLSEDDFKEMLRTAFNYLACQDDHSHYPKRYSVEAQSTLPPKTTEAQWRVALYQNMTGKLNLLSDLLDVAATSNNKPTSPWGKAFWAKAHPDLFGVGIFSSDNKDVIRYIAQQQMLYEISDAIGDDEINGVRQFVLNEKAHLKAELFENDTIDLNDDLLLSRGNSPFIGVITWSMPEKDKCQFKHDYFMHQHARLTNHDGDNNDTFTPASFTI